MPVLAVAATAGALVLSGCLATPDAPPAPTLPAGVSVELQQLRADVAPRQAQVHVTNGSDAPITVGDVRVEDPRFDGPARRVIADRESTIPVGGAVDIRVQLPGVDCAAHGDGVSQVVLEIVADTGATEVAASARDRLGFLAPLHQRECLYERVTDAATLAFTAFRPAAPGTPATLELTVTPTGGGEVTVVGIERTNLIEFTGAPGDGELYPADVEVAAQSADPVVVPIPVVPFRCDPHAVQEDKRGTLFDVRVRLGDEAGEFELFVGDRMRGEILSWVADWCGFGG